MSDRESLEFDVVVVGGGPAGLSCAIRLRQIAAEAGREISVCVVEKSAAPGGHTLAGAVFETRALDELLPAWRDSESPIQTAAGEDKFLFLTAKRAWKLPTPPSMKNEGNFVVSLGRVVAWLAARAEADGVEIFPGFAAAEILFDDQGAVAGVATGDVGVKKDGSRGANFQRGVELRAKYTVFAEGCRGSLTEDLMRKFDLRRESSPQTYGIGIKELWEVKDENSRPGEILHTVGWPLSASTYGGSFVYHLEPGKIALGFVVGLDYDNPHLSPYDEFQRFKHHPAVAPLLAGGRRIGYGARALNEGGWQSVPKLAVAGGLLVGCAAGFLNVPKIKGAHTAMKSGMLAAEAAAAALAQNRARDLLAGYEQAVRESWIGEELRKARNIRPAFRRGFWAGMAYAAIDAYLLRGRAPWTFSHHADHARLKKAAQAKPIDYPKPDGVLSFSKLENLAYSGVNHEADQPPHLRLTDQAAAAAINWREYGGPEARYCPAGVYEFVPAENGAPDEMQLVINAQNCVHCKTCDIKDPTQNIRWTPPEGGGGPNYESL